jgi:hypothetical protein
MILKFNKTYSRFRTVKIRRSGLINRIVQFDKSDNPVW